MNTLAKWTLDDYHSMIAAGILQDRQVEFLAGEIHDMPPEGPLHTFYGGSLADFFRQNIGNRALVREAHPITLANSEPEPDIAIVRGEWANYRLRHPTAEEIFLVVEISESTLVKDLDRKKAIYAAAGIVEYWVLNLPKLQLIVFRHPQGQDYLSRQEFKEGEIAPLMFPDVKISLTQLFRQAS
jgi:Uma2 family endonuclease